MCGIGGIYQSRGSTQNELRDRLSRMAAQLHHRGPDGVGMYLDDGVGLVNTRLAIVDLAGGDQPLGTPDGRFWAVQNGEIYNHADLRAELARLGHRFATHCDTEVIAHAFAAWGPAALDRFNGPFALAVWDRVRRELFVARDRFGVRPLFLQRLGGELRFASEMKALLAQTDARRELDPLAVGEIFTLWANQPQRSVFAGISELPPGHWLRLGPSGEELYQWWDLEFVPPPDQRQSSVDDLADELAELLGDATRLRLQADVPVACYLSGGLDSSAIVGLARRAEPKELRCFSIGFDDPRYDEGRYQREVAQALGVDLTQRQVSAADIAQVFPDVVRLAERPVLRTAPAPMLLLSRLARDAGFKVVLTGEGADELFAGYTTFAESQVRRFWAKDPTSVWRPALLRRLYPWLVRDLNRAPQFTKQFFAAGLTDTDDVLYSHLRRFETSSRTVRFLAAETRAAIVADGAVARLRASLPSHLDKATGLGRAQYVEIATFLSGYLLHSQGDRMLMGSGVEGRFPFLDPRIARFAASLPDSLRLAGLQEKYLLRRSMQDVIPDVVRRRPKHPYRAPIHQAFCGPDAPAWVGEVMNPARVAATGLFDVPAVQRLWQKAERAGEMGLGETDEMALVGVLSTQLLHEQFVARSPSEAEPVTVTRCVLGATSVPFPQPAR